MMDEGCTHPRLDGQNRCPICGARFVQVWKEFGAVRYVPLVVSFIAAGVFGWLLSGGSAAGANPMGAILLILVFAYFGVRVIRGVLDLLTSHVTYGGQILGIRKRSLWNPFSTRDASVTIGRRQFNLNDEAARLLKEGESALFQYLRWTRTVMAIYKPTRR